MPGGDYLAYLSPFGSDISSEFSQVGASRETRGTKPLSLKGPTGPACSHVQVWGLLSDGKSEVTAADHWDLAVASWRRLRTANPAPHEAPPVPPTFLTGATFPCHLVPCPSEIMAGVGGTDTEIPLFYYTCVTSLS